MDSVGWTVRVPAVGTGPMPSMLALLASVVRQERTTLCPALMDVGWAVMVAVGAGAAGGGGRRRLLNRLLLVAAGDGQHGDGSGDYGDGAAIALISVIAEGGKHVLLLGECYWPLPGHFWFIQSRTDERNPRLAPVVRIHYFQLQFGMEFEPPCESCCCSVPSESMVQI